MLLSIVYDLSLVIIPPWGYNISKGKTVIFVESNNQVLEVLAIQDTLRSAANEAIKLLHDMGIKVIMLTGDSSSTAKAIGKQACVDEVFAELLPEQKLNLLRS